MDPRKIPKRMVLKIKSIFNGKINNLDTALFAKSRYQDKCIFKFENMSANLNDRL